MYIQFPATLLIKVSTLLNAILLIDTKEVVWSTPARSKCCLIITMFPEFSTYFKSLDCIKVHVVVNSLPMQAAAYMYGNTPIVVAICWVTSFKYWDLIDKLGSIHLRKLQHLYCKIDDFKYSLQIAGIHIGDPYFSISFITRSELALLLFLRFFNMSFNFTYWKWLV